MLGASVGVVVGSRCSMICSLSNVPSTLKVQGSTWSLGRAEPPGCGGRAGEGGRRSAHAIS